jgi:SulP family sulfate permease
MRVLNKDIKERGIQLALMDVHIPVAEAFERAGFIKEMGSDYLIEKRGEAISIVFKYIDHDYCKNVCPYALFYECWTVK